MRAIVIEAGLPVQLSPGDYEVVLVDEFGRADESTVQRASLGDEVTIVASVDLNLLMDSR